MNIRILTIRTEMLLTCGGLAFAFSGMDLGLLAMVQHYYWYQFAHWSPILIHALPNLLIGLLIAIVGIIFILIGDVFLKRIRKL